MKILLTGGSGFIGRNLIERLGPKYDICSPGHGELDLANSRGVDTFFQKSWFDVIIHCAVKPAHRNAKDPTQILFANTRMFFNLVRQRDKFDRFICVGSGAVYAQQHPIVKVSEEYFGTHIPDDEHGLFRYISTIYMEKKEAFVDLRPFSVFGKYEDYAIRFISNNICKAILDLPLTIKQNRRFDFIFVDDLISVIDHLIQRGGPSRCYNVTPDEAVDLRTVAEKIREVSGKNLPIQIAQEGMGAEYSGSNRCLQREIPGLRLTALDEAIQRLYQWYFDCRSAINRQVLLFDK